MADVSKDVVWRNATPDDHDAILRLDAGGGAYDIGDYLAERLRDYLTDPLTVCTIGVLGDKVVTFDFFVLIDEGETLLGRGARTDKAFRGSGLWKIARYQSSQNCRRHFKDRNVKRIVGCTSWFGSHMSEAFGNPSIPVIRNYFHLKMNKESTNLPLKPVTATDTRFMDLNECKQVISNKRINWKLFPNSHIIIGREPFKILPKNYTRMLRYCKAVYGTFDQQNDLESIKTISFGTGFHHKGIYIYELDIYSIISKAEEVLRHISAHNHSALKFAAHFELIMTVFIPMKVDAVEVLQKLTQINPLVQIQSQPSKHFFTANPIDKYIELTHSLSKL